MEAGYVLSQIQRTNRNLLWTGVVLLAAVLGAAGVAHRYLYNFIFGPFATDLAALAVVGDPDSQRRYFWTVTGEEVQQSGLQEIRRRMRERTREVISEAPVADYLLLRQGNRLLFVKAPLEQTTRKTFSGEARRLPTDVTDRVAREVPDAEARAAILPYMLDATGFRKRGYWGLGIGVPLGLLAVVTLTRGLTRRSAPERHPAYLNLARYGEPATVAAAIDAEMAAPDVRRIGRCTITPCWLIVELFYRVDVAPLEDIVWLYKKTVQHRHYFIKTGETNSACVHLRDGGALQIQGKCAQVEEMLRELCERVPWAVSGYGAEIERAWKKERETFLSAVDSRRAEILKGLTQEQSEAASGEEAGRRGAG